MYPQNEMQWVSALSTRPSLEAAIAEVVQQAKRSLEGPADLGLVFISSAFGSEYSRLMPLLQEALRVPAIVGCGARGAIGTGPDGETEEIEADVALSLSLARLPGVDVKTFHISAPEMPDLDSPPDTWVEMLGVPASAQPQFILLADPFSAKINDLLQGLDYAYPGAPKVGGLAGGDSGIRGGALFCDYQLYREGTVGVALSGNVVLDTIVAQGCRPIGRPYRVTEGDRNILLKVEEETDDRGNLGVEQSPLDALRELVQTLNEEDKDLAQHSLFVGLVSDEFKMTLEPGDFLIRNLLGVDPKVGAIAIGDRVRPGQRIQFHLRDARTSAEDLEMLLSRYSSVVSGSGMAGAGALMFSCMGRGEGLYSEPNFDSRLFGRYLNNIPLSGFFCNGEIGPVGGSTFLHGYTSVFGICRQNS
jgi:small ligand-binding sensory domain FIST